MQRYNFYMCVHAHCVQTLFFKFQVKTCMLIGLESTVSLDVLLFLLKSVIYKLACNVGQLPSSTSLEFLNRLYDERNFIEIIHVKKFKIGRLILLVCVKAYKRSYLEYEAYRGRKQQTDSSRRRNLRDSISKGLYESIAGSETNWTMDRGERPVRATGTLQLTDSN